ncbi:hypothetical protein OGAPHI_000669 [Ogataea philodendri]|uniref:Subtelomeric hrmA-associated cluster protein AFUB-079030/YDR124W-like helical bundle domain-containing protein n=1 Tax=Ogataea philodendri TaxID=1378263 RepID=A0A9P8PEU3_9ASCO|nr:uncharacterized protein OGAPHI_000669 [Ogataea philodendri]KAH3670958.1 hypothetical protein OGAPHI_000669 [Ogataea philodendri]
MAELKEKLREVRQLTDSIYRDFGLKCELTLSDPKNVLTASELCGLSIEQETESAETSLIEKTFKSIEINPRNSREVDEYLAQCFDEFQQIPCKLLAKSWIRLIEPKKQSRYPYKLGDRTKPLWWPETCRHKEPDHLRKEERIDLLVCIIRTFRFQAKEMIAAAESVGDFNLSHSEPSKMGRLSRRKLDILEEMFKVLNADPGAGPVTVSKPGKKYSSKVYTKKVIEHRMKFQQDENVLPSIQTPEKSNRIQPKTPSPRKFLASSNMISGGQQTGSRQTSTPDMGGFSNENLEPALNQRNPLSLLTPNNFNLLLLYGPSSSEYGGLFQGNENARTRAKPTYFQPADHFDSDSTLSENSPIRNAI